MQGGAYTSCHVPEQVSRLCIFALGRFCLSLRYPLDDLLWCHRQFIDLDAQGLECILYRPRHRRWRPRSAFSRKANQCHMMIDLDMRYFGNGWYQVVVHCCRQVLAFGAVAHLFVQGYTDALRDASPNLALQ